jgi:hypothetical protein
LEIGQEDKSYYEFTARGFSEPLEYTCSVGVDCSTETFPKGMCRDPECQEGPFNSDVRIITITFMLDQDYRELVLRLDRAGLETTVVTVDAQQTYQVTFGMLRSNENYTVGGYDLVLGVLEKGSHTIQLVVAEDGNGNGAFTWDALTLFAR